MAQREGKKGKGMLNKGREGETSPPSRREAKPVRPLGGGGGEKGKKKEATAGCEMKKKKGKGKGCRLVRLAGAREIKGPLLPIIGKKREGGGGGVRARRKKEGKKEGR